MFRQPKLAYNLYKSVNNHNITHYISSQVITRESDTFNVMVFTENFFRVSRDDED